MTSPAAYWKHMRMGFQLLLAPLFLWGAALAGIEPGMYAIIGFVALHLFLYPGATAFNGAYDRDEGPVSGLPQPPPPPPRLLEFSLLLQLAGAILAALVGAAFFLLYALLALVFAGYSHPATRWKAKPVASALFAALGQGVLGFAAGWAAATGALPPLGDANALGGAVVAALATVGLYPSTQIFQVEEDARRGDRTLAVALGPTGALRLGALCLLLAGAAAAALLLARQQPLDAALIAAGFAALALSHLLFAPRVARADPPLLYRWATATRLCATAGFLAFAALQLTR
jgi:1,4-dihydroxy-2-naphthoate octaprenyltransferase